MAKIPPITVTVKVQRLDKLPAWARSYILQLEGRCRAQEAQLDGLTGAPARAIDRRDLPPGFYVRDLSHNDLSAYRALPVTLGFGVVFADGTNTFELRPDNNQGRVTGKPGLSVYSQDSLEVLPEVSNCVTLRGRK